MGRVMATAVEVAAMRRAIALSAAGIGTTSPNPPVGCVVLTAAGQVAGEGYHQRKGEAHAETHALAAAGTRAVGGTAVVTLEPCNHQGRTPACRQALVDAKVARVVVAVLDPTSRGEGGAARLRQAGVDVEIGVLRDEAMLVLGPWLRALETHRPVMIWPYVTGPGGITAAPENLDDIRLLTLSVDAVLRDGEAATEAVPNSHGAGILRLDKIAGEADPAVIAASLYDGGVRRVLLSAGLDIATRYLDQGLIDQVHAYVPFNGPSLRLKETQPWLQLPPEFKITAATKVDGFVRIDGAR